MLLFLIILAVFVIIQHSYVCLTNPFFQVITSLFQLELSVRFWKCHFNPVVIGPIYLYLSTAKCCVLLLWNPPSRPSPFNCYFWFQLNEQLFISAFQYLVVSLFSSYFNYCCVIYLFFFKFWTIGKLVFPSCFWSLYNFVKQSAQNISLRSHDAKMWNDYFLVAKLNKALNHMSGM